MNASSETRRDMVRAALERAATIEPTLAADPDDLLVEASAGAYMQIALATDLAMEIACEALYQRACSCAARECYCVLVRVPTSPEALQAQYAAIHGRPWRTIGSIAGAPRLAPDRAARSTSATVR